MNPLDRMLTHRGAECLVFPTLRAGWPTGQAALASLDRAAEDFARYDWVLFVGQLGVQHLLERASAQGLDLLGDGPTKLATVGHGAFKHLRTLGSPPDWAPILHTPSGIADGMGELSGRRILLVRESHATGALPDLMTARGAKVTAITGHRIAPDIDPEVARVAFGRRIDLLALANPTVVRIFVEATEGLNLDLERCLAGVTIAAVGEATAATARRRGLALDLIAGGRLKSLVAELLELFAGRRSAA